MGLAPTLQAWATLRLHGGTMHIYDLDTPALVVDLDVLERNIRDMAAHCAQTGIALRAHTKTHKVPEIAQMQVAAGSAGIWEIVRR